MLMYEYMYDRSYDDNFQWDICIMDLVDSNRCHRGEEEGKRRMVKKCGHIEKLSKARIKEKVPLYIISQTVVTQISG